ARFVILGIVVLAALAAGIPACRHFLLRLPAQAIVVPQPAVPSCDIVVIAVDADGAGALSAADLVQRGVAHRVAVFSDPPGPVDREFLRRGIPYYNAAATTVGQLRQLGVADVEIIPRAVGGSADEGSLLPEWCDRNHFRSVVLVVNSDHGRRLQRIMRRTMRGHSATVIVYPSPYTGFDPDSWWQTHDGARTLIPEFQKLVMDVLRHPFS
ncbi:MAG TPA: hypothetical protein VFU76_11645, partial [Terriglobales bacterium]|nr:hypothetical protein [Terriglobales bacterium]